MYSKGGKACFLLPVSNFPAHFYANKFSQVIVDIARYFRRVFPDENDIQRWVAGERRPVDRQELKYRASRIEERGVAAGQLESCVQEERRERESATGPNTSVGRTDASQDYSTTRLPPSSSLLPTASSLPPRLHLSFSGPPADGRRTAAFCSGSCTG